MSPEEARLAHGKRFAADLRQIREKRGLALEDLLAETKVPRGLIEQFEATALLDHEMFNQVYLRSFVRSYAQAVGLPVEQVLASLEAVFEERYEGELGVAFLGRKPAPRPEPEAPAEEGAAAPAPEAPAPPQKEAPPPDEPPPPETPAPGDTPAPPERGGGPSAGASAAKEAAPLRMQRPLARHRAGVIVGGTGLRLVMGAGLIVVMALVVYFFLLRSEAPPAPAPEAVPVDTVAAEAPPPPPPPILPDTMTVYLVAEGGPLRRIRVKVDDGIRRPYWLEQGDSLLFRPVERITIQSRYYVPRARVTVEGRPVPIAPTDTMIVVTRETAQALLNTSPR